MSVRICLFDWNHGGHHAEFAKAFATALRPGAEVVLAAPQITLDSVGDLPATMRSLGEGRPRPQAGGNGTSKAELANAELDLIESLVTEIEPDHLVLLWADPVLRWLLKRPSLPTAVSLYLFFARLHYPRAYDAPLSAKDRLGAILKEANVARWLRRSDAHALFGFDPLAARRWARYSGANAYYLPEPPLNYRPEPRPSQDRAGCILFGYLDERKGIDLITSAVEDSCEGLRLKLQGEPAPEYAEQLKRQIERMRAAGVLVETRLERLAYEEALDSLAGANAALLSFGWVPPGSRVLLEAASCGTPVIGSSVGAVGHLIRNNNLGLAVDPTDPVSLRRAIQEMAIEPICRDRYAEGLRSYASRLNENAFRKEIRRAFSLSGA